MVLATRTTNSTVLALAAGALGAGWGGHEVLTHGTASAAGTVFSAALLLANLAVAGCAWARLRPYREH